MAVWSLLVTLVLNLVAFPATGSLVVAKGNSEAPASAPSRPAQEKGAKGAPLEDWTQIGEAGGAAVHSLALSPSAPGQIYAGTYFEGLFATTEGGVTWSNTLGASVSALALNPQTESTLYAGTWHDGAHRSVDGGDSWTPINSGLQANEVYALLVDPQAPATVYAGTEMGVFKSTNGGGQWQGASSGFSGRVVHALASCNSTLIAGSDMGAFRSTNGAASWTPANDGLHANQVFALAGTSGTVYAGTDRGVFRSDDCGAGWALASSGLPVAAVEALAVAPGEPRAVFAGTALGAFFSGDGGTNWEAINDGLTGWALQINALVLDASTVPWTLYAGTGEGVWRRTITVQYGRLVYLPVVLRGYSPPDEPVEPVGIHGRVTFNGAPAAGIDLALQRYDGDSASTVSTARTDTTGHYLFAGVPSLSTSDEYYVRYGPNTTDPGYLFVWFGPDIPTYVAGTRLHGGDFDVANVHLLLPPSGTTTALPATFTWQRRMIAGDTYRFEVFEPQGDDAWWTDDLGDVGGFTMTGLPSGGAYGQEYGWDVWVFDGPDSFGSSFYYHAITFSPSQGATIEPLSRPDISRETGGAPHAEKQRR
jgi:photosystem II stability/assembly factor-like uncharacterized protein